MNERIQELAEQATSLYYNMHGEWEEDFDKAKFAQLIVRECLVQVNEVYTTLDNSDERVGVARVGLTIAAHFGVEE